MTVINKIIHKFIRDRADYEENGELFYSIIPENVQAYSYELKQGGNPEDPNDYIIRYVLGTGGSTYMEIVNGQGRDTEGNYFPELSKEFTVDSYQQLDDTMVAIFDREMAAKIVGSFEPLFRYETLPEATVDILGKICQYTGVTDDNFVNGYFYKCEFDLNTSSYVWNRIDVQSRTPIDQHYNENSTNPQSGTAVAEAISVKVDKNADIVAATKTKITYDEKGLVTAGTDLVENDIPSIHLSKISDVTVTPTEVNRLDGISDNVQSLINATNRDVATINSKIPDAATPSNQLADKQYVADSINNMAAYYITCNAAGDAFATHAALLAGPYYYDGALRTPTKNDYAIVLADETKEDAASRYTYTGSQWAFQYIVNDTPFTQSQLDAINSGITANLVNTYSTHVADTDIHVTTNDKENWNNKVTKNDAITAGQHTKITYDAKGLVTAGEDIVTSDVTDLDATASEINQLHGSNVLTADLTKLHNLSATAAEINELHLSSVTTSDLTKLHEVSATSTELNTLHGITSTTSELNQLHESGVVKNDLTKLHNTTADANELSKLHGATITTTELNYLSGASSNIQNQISTIGGSLSDHTSNTSNPHSVTKSQVGLGNVDNTSDIDKPVSTAQQTALDKKVDKVTTSSRIYGTDAAGSQTTYDYNLFGKIDDVKVGTASAVTDKVAYLGTMAGEDKNDYVLANTPITGTTHTKITYDSKGLVTAGTDITLSDVTDVTATISEVNTLSGITASTAELNILNGVTATTSEINVLNGIEATTAELNELHNSNITNDDLIKLHGVTASASELNILNGAELTTTELNYVNGVTSSIQTQLDSKVAKTSTANQVYGTSTADTQTTLTYDTANTGNTIVKRDANGQVNVNLTPTENTHTTSKKYVDDKVASAITEAVVFKGIVADQTALPSSDNTNGDMYWITEFVAPAPSGITPGRSGAAIYKGNPDNKFEFTQDAIYQPDTQTIILNSNGQLAVRISAVANNSLVAQSDGLYVDISGKVDKNAAITGATHTKITYDSKGLVTSGTDIVASDVTDLTATSTEINQLHGSSVTTADLTKLHDVTATALELNTLNGITATTTELNYVHGVTSGIQSQIDSKVAKNADITGATHTKITYDNKGLVTAGTDLAESDIPSLHLSKVTDVTATYTEVNQLHNSGVVTSDLTKLHDVTATASELNILHGATLSTAELNTLNGITASTAELNVLTNMTADTSELNILDGASITTTELNYLSGVTSNVQTQLDSKIEHALVITDYTA